MAMPVIFRLQVTLPLILVTCGGTSGYLYAVHVHVALGTCLSPSWSEENASLLVQHLSN